MYLYCIFGMTPKFLDSKILLYPFEENFNLPSVFIQISELQVLKRLNYLSEM